MASPPPETPPPKMYTQATLAGVAVACLCGGGLVGFGGSHLWHTTHAVTVQSDAAVDLRSDGGPADGAVDMRSDGGPHDGGRPPREAAQQALARVTHTIQRQRELVARLRQECAGTLPDGGTAPAGHPALSTKPDDIHAQLSRLRDAHEKEHSQNLVCRDRERAYQQVEERTKNLVEQVDAMIKSFGSSIEDYITHAVDKEGNDIPTDPARAARDKLGTLPGGRQALLLKKAAIAMEKSLKTGKTSDAAPPKPIGDWDQPLKLLQQQQHVAASQRGLADSRKLCADTAAQSANAADPSDDLRLLRQALGMAEPMGQNASAGGRP